MVIAIDYQMDKRYYKKKGASYRERLRCPLCGKLSDIGFFSQDHQFGVYRFCFAGYKKISCKLVIKSLQLMTFLKEDLATRMLEIIQEFTGVKYYSQEEVNTIRDTYERRLAEVTLYSKPKIFPTILVKSSLPIKPVVQLDVIPVVKPPLKPFKVVIE